MLYASFSQERYGTTSISHLREPPPLLRASLLQTLLGTVIIDARRSIRARKPPLPDQHPANSPPAAPAPPSPAIHSRADDGHARRCFLLLLCRSIYGPRPAQVEERCVNDDAAAAAVDDDDGGGGANGGWTHARERS